jgi:predicted Rossmann fold flavoprotein
MQFKCIQGIWNELYSIMPSTDIIIIGAGAAGLMCAITAGKRGRRVVVLDHSAKPAEKIRISGGGRCNFTNLHTTPSHYLSRNPRFCVSALARYTPQDFVALVEKHGITWHEKTLGQLFCDGSSQQIIDMLLHECRDAGVEIRLSTTVNTCEKRENGFRLATSAGEWEAVSLVIASGGLSIPKMGATGFGYAVAEQFSIPIVPTTPALVPFTLDAALLQRTAAFSGVGLPCMVQCGKQQFEEAMLFTHRGLSGPAILQISSYWESGQPITVNLAPHQKVETLLLQVKATHPKQEAATVLAQIWPKRLAQQWVEWHGLTGRLADISNARIKACAGSLHRWVVTPNGTEGYRTAEVTRGGVDTDALSSQTMETKAVKGLYFIGEVVDVTGHLGGFNFQWAWASGYAAGQVA